jgi:16S rRNA G966 N2-methylase RsmD
MISLGVPYMITHTRAAQKAHAWVGHRPRNDVPHFETNFWVFEGGEEARQKRMREVGIDQLLHEEKRANYFKGGKWQLTPDEIKHIKLDEVAYFSLCPKTHADIITQAIVDCVGGEADAKTMTITDGCAGVGGVSMSLIISDKFKHVNSVESDPIRQDMLQSNITTIKRQDNRTTSCVVSDNYLNVMNTLKQDIVFFDPPFGGPGYKYYQNAVLFLGGRHMADIANDLLANTGTKQVFIRTPENFDEAYFKKKLLKNVVFERVIDLDRTTLYRVYLGN